MITPSQIREKKISTVENGGYDRDEVNSLLLEIIDSYEAVYNENKSLYRKMEILANKIEEYRADEDSIKSALITAQKMASKLTSEAKEKADEALSKSAQSAQQTVVDAKEKADKIISEAREYVAGLTKEKAEAAEEIINEAQEKANNAIDSANVVANNALAHAKKLAGEIVSKAKAEKEYHSDILSKLKNESKEFRSTLVNLYETQLDNIKNIAGSNEDYETETETIEALESELDSLLSNIGDLESIDDEPVNSQADDSTADEEIQGTFDAEEIAAKAEKIKEDPKEITNADEEIKPALEQQINDDIDEIIDEIEAVDDTDFEPVSEADKGDEPPSEDEVMDALNSFSADEITPIDENVKSIPVINDEPEFESAMPFESFFDTKKGHEGTDKPISLIPPDDDDEDDNSKFKGFFKKKK